MTTTRKNAAARCAAESAAAERFAQAAQKFAAEGRTRAAWRAADTAHIAATCAIQAHEELWEAACGELTDDEFAAFEAAEIAQMSARAAARAAAEAVRRAQAAYDAAR